MKNSSSLLLVLVTCSVLVTSCQTKKPYYNSEHQEWAKATLPDSLTLTSTVILIGDAGNMDGVPIFNTMKYHMQEADALLAANEKMSGRRSAVVFLGDNIYYSGLPPEDQKREEEEKVMRAQLDILKGFNGGKFFVQGNHDWNESKKGGMEAVIRQEQFIESYDDSVEMVPNNACPGPYEYHLNDDMVLVFLNSEWMLTNHERPEGPENNCYVVNQYDLMVQLADVVQRNRGKHIVLMQHHPLKSNSNHGGRFSLVDNIFPLTLVRENLYIPLPIIGSIYPLMRKYGVSKEDIPNPQYQKMINDMMDVIGEEKSLVFAAGHDHNLQMSRMGEIPHIVSGSGCKTNYLARGSNMHYGQSEHGFSKLNYYNNGEVWAEFWTVDENEPRGKLMYREPLYAIAPIKRPDVPLVDYRERTLMRPAGEEYAASAFKEFWLGEHYRRTWAEPVRMKYLDMAHDEGGLTPIKKGGGKQTISLRLQNPDSVQFALRGINKDPSGAVPEQFMGTVAQDLVQDQISTAHPYGAFIIPKLAEAVNLYHTEPKLVYVPYSPLLGPYINDMSNKVAMLEVRPDEDLSQYSNFGFTNNAVSTKTMYKKLRKDNDDEVDQYNFLRARLFDMYINDYDRHEGQWRWSEIEKEGKGMLYRPIPIDRDQVFAKFDGVIPYLISRKWAVRLFDNFDYDVNDVIGLNASAKTIDRKLLTSLDYGQWMSAVDSMQRELTDEVIVAAVHDQPAESFVLTGDETIAKLKSRRDKMRGWASEYYKILAKYVDITGTDKHEYFEVTRPDDTTTVVKIFKMLKDGEVKDQIYQRTFSSNETKEIRLYALDDEDSIVISGAGKGGIKLRVVGGGDDDAIIDNTSGKGSGIFVYDQTTDNNRITKGMNTRLRTSKKDYVNDYDIADFQYDYAGPLLAIEFNRDNGIYLGGGFVLRNQGFRKHPKTEHRFIANYAINTNSTKVRYEGTFYSLFGRNTDLYLFGTSYGPTFLFNYFGQGNDSPEQVGDIEFYRVNQNRIEIAPYIQKRVGKLLKLGVGPAYESYNIKDTDNTILEEPTLVNQNDINRRTEYISAKGYANLVYVDHPSNPSRGTRFINSAAVHNGIRGESDRFYNINSEFSFYVTPNAPFRITFATRFGLGANFGDYKFYQSQFLGGVSNLRGYRITRFAGKTAAYNNTEARLRMFQFRSYVVNGSVGLIGFIDNGRVWSDFGFQSDKWHTSYGPGAYLDLFDIITLSATMGFSEEGEFFVFKFGQFF